jgi:hypothetical protein
LRPCREQAIVYTQKNQIKQYFLGDHVVAMTQCSKNATLLGAVGAIHHAPITFRLLPVIHQRIVRQEEVFLFAFDEEPLAIIFGNEEDHAEKPTAREFRRRSVQFEAFELAKPRRSNRMTMTWSMLLSRLILILMEQASDGRA